MKGTYVLIMENHADREIEIGKLGQVEFRSGFYAYVGSALSGLAQRIGRHLHEVGEKKKLHWHIDFFLASSGVEVKEVVFAETAKRKECEIAAKLQMKKGLEHIANFGCSDCTCRSHLFFSTSFDRLKEDVYNGFYESGIDEMLNKDF